LVAREGTRETAWAGAAAGSTCTIPGYHPPRPRVTLKDRQRIARQDWILEHVLVVILILSAAAVILIICLIIATHH
jgi:hypothetical protein